MTNKSNLLILFFTISLFKISNGQQLAQFSQYTYNTIAINSAYAGSRDYLLINVLNRNQWVGIQGAPTTQTLSINTRLRNSKFGIGISAINDKLGFESLTFLYTDLSYTLDLNSFSTSKLSFGIKLGVNKYDLDKEVFEDENNRNDISLTNFSSRWVPNFGVGLYYRNNFLYLGLGIPKILEQTSKTTDNKLITDRLNYYFNGGYLIEINSHLKLKPSFLIKYVNGAPLAIDTNIHAILWNEALWLGANYRWGDAFCSQIRFKVFEGLYVGYAYDFTTSNLSAFSSGSHEVILNYQIKIPKRCSCPDLYN